eukprot:g1044.t1
MEAAARSHSSSVMLKSEDGRMSCVIMPNSTKRVAWDVTTAVLLVYIAFTAPFRIAFNVDPVGFWYVLERFIDIFFIVDLAINFRTAYSNREGAIVTDVWKMAKHYLWTWFLIDFVSSVPVDLIFEWSAVNSEDVMGSEATQAGKLLKTSKILKTIRLAKMARMAKLGVLMEKFEDAYDLSKSGVKLVKLFSVLIVISHFNACGWYWVGSLTENPNESWLHYAELRVEDTTTGCENIERQVGCDDARMLHYLTSFYWAIMTTTTVGYGDISPKSDGERVYAILAMIVGGGYFGYIIASMASLVQKIDANQQHYRDKMEKVKSYMTHRKIPKDLQMRIRRYYKHYFSKVSALDEKTIMSELSTFLRQELALHLIHDTIYQIPLFQALLKEDLAALTQLVPVFKPLTSNAGDYLIQAGEVSRELFILIEGQLQVFDDLGEFVRDVYEG